MSIETFVRGCRGTAIFAEHGDYPYKHHAYQQHVEHRGGKRYREGGTEYGSGGAFVGKNTKAIKEYISNQLKQDQESDQLSIYDPKDPFTGGK